MTYIRCNQQCNRSWHFSITF